MKKNDLVSSEIFKIRQRQIQKLSLQDKSKIWSSVETEKEQTIITIVIPTHGCRHARSPTGGCSFCGYINDSVFVESIDENLIISTLDKLLTEYESATSIHLKIFNSGSFFDPEDVPISLRESILKLVNNHSNIHKISVENRADYILEELEIAKDFNNRLKRAKLEIGLGLESSNNTILVDCINKGITVEVFEKAVTELKAIGILIKAYLFLKPPFLTEREAIIDLLKTAEHAINLGIDTLSINPLNIQRGTLVESLWNRRQYRTPWLWSVLYVIRKIKEKYPKVTIICDPIAAGKPRGAHNCGKCDEMVMKKIKAAVKQTTTYASANDNICECYSEWLFLINTPLEALRTIAIEKLP